MTDSEMLQGGIDFQVAVNGVVEKVKIRALPMRLLPAYLEIYNRDEPACIELFCDKPPGWSDNLTRECFEKILEEGERLNLDFLTRYATRTVTRRKQVSPPDDALIAKIIESLKPMFLASGAPSPSSPSKATGPSKRSLA
jgi:hypothetical protein